MIRTAVFFAPHQDDELNNFGAAVCRDLDAGLEVRVVLCTDGSASGVKRALGSGEPCHMHPGRHVYPLTDAEFTAARDREFTASCRAMGVPEEGIVISPLRGRDGALTVEQAAEIIRAALADLNPHTTAVRSLFPVTAFRQNPDHTALARAAETAFRTGAFAALEQYYELIFTPPTPPDIRLERLRPDAAGRARMLAAADAYALWDPANGRYAIGYHSVADEFIALRKDPVSILVNE